MVGPSEFHAWALRSGGASAHTTPKRSTNLASPDVKVEPLRLEAVQLETVEARSRQVLGRCG